MTKVEYTEYETVEVAQERYECENCSAIVGEDDIATVCYIEGEPRSTARVSDNSVETKHLCDGCTELPHALKVREKKEYLKARWKGVKEATDRSINWAAPVFFMCVGGLAILFAGVINPESAEPAYSLMEPTLGLIIAICCLLVGSIMGKSVIDQ